MKVRTRIGLVVAAVGAFVALAGAALPHLMDVEAYRPAIVQAVKDATGRELVIEGPLQLSMLPQPRISARKVRFANAVGTKGAQMADVEWIGVSPAWGPLLLGRLEVGRLTLYKPVIVLEADAQGRPNWQFAPGAGAAQAAGASSAGFHLAIGRLRIVQGTLSYTAPATSKVLTAADIDVTASANSLDGPFTLAGTATVNGVPLDIALDVGGPAEKGHRTTATLKIAGSRLEFAGDLGRIAADAEVSGKLSLETASLADVAAAVWRVAGETPPALVAEITDRVVFEGGVDLSAGRVALADFKLAIGGDSAAGTLALTRGAKPSLEGRLSLAEVDLDRWIDRLSEDSDAAPTPLPPLALSLAVEAKEVTYRKDRVRDAVLVVTRNDRGVIEIPRLRAVLPGDAVLQAKAVAPTATAPAAVPTAPTAAKPAPDAVRTVGEFSLASPRPRDTLAWLGMDMSGVPTDKLQTLGFGGKITSTAKAVKIDQLVLDLDGVKAAGGGTVTFGLPLNVTSSVELERFDLDAYVPKSTAAAPPPVAPVAPAAPAAPAIAAPTESDKKAPVLGLKAKVAKLVYRGETLNGVEADLAIQGNLLKLNGLKVADLLGAKLDLKGQVADFGTDPRFDLTFTTSMPDTDKLLGYVGLPKFINGKIGASTANGSVAGTMDAVAVRNVTVTMAGATARATGSVALGEKFAFDFPSFGLQAQDASQLVSVASGQRQSGLGALDVAGAFKGNEKNMTLDGNLTALGTPMIGRISASVSGRPSVDVNLRIPGTLDIDNWLGVGGAPAAAPANATPGPARSATGKAIDLSALRAFDATLNLETSVIAVASLKVLYGDMTASLRNGVFKVSKLTGQFYGGAVDFTGTVDASKAAMSIDFAGSLQGIYLGELLRGAASTSTFGNDHLMVAVDGKINVMQIEVQGQGITPGQIRDSLTGRGKVSGYLYPSVAAGSLGLASFATSIGSIFSTEMGFGSAVLSSFINVQSPVAGDVALSNGVLSLQNQKVQGRNAVASIDSRTSLTAATTETTIALGTGTSGTADYVVKVTGPVSSPTMNIGR